MSLWVIACFRLVKIIRVLPFLKIFNPIQFRLEPHVENNVEVRHDEGRPRHDQLDGVVGHQDRVRDGLVEELERRQRNREGILGSSVYSGEKNNRKINK